MYFLFMITLSKRKIPFDSKYFSKSDIAVLEEVWDKFGIMSDRVLRDYSHFS